MVSSSCSQWDDETDMAKLEECVRSVQVDGLLWGASKLVPVGYGIKKLQINCVVEDDKVGTDFLEEEITKFEDYVSNVPTQTEAVSAQFKRRVKLDVFVLCVSGSECGRRSVQQDLTHTHTCKHSRATAAG